MKKIFYFFSLFIFLTSNVFSQKNFHDTKGDINVDGGGQLNYSLPIALPPGVKTVAPQLNLNYSSGSTNKVVGYGWNLSGLSSIARTGKSIEKDGMSKVIELNYNDFYLFNGQRLILKSGVYGKNGATYVTDNYSNIKIKSIGNIVGKSWSGPEYWEVTFENGSQAWYGAISSGESNARTPIEYNIVKWTDPQGNYITYDYSLSNNVSVINKVSWGGNETLGKPHFNEILFIYSTRELIESSYVSGISFIQNKILSEVKVNTNGKQFKRYKIDYAKNETAYEFVDKITEYNSANENAAPASFYYEKDPTVTNVFKQDSRFEDLYNYNLSGDFNGDGKLDFIKDKKLMFSRLDSNNDFYTVSYLGELMAVGSDLKNNILENKQTIFTGEFIDNYNKFTVRSYIFSDTSKNLELINSYTFDISSYQFKQGPPTVSMPIYPDYPNFTLIRTNAIKRYLFLEEGNFSGSGLSDFRLAINQVQFYSYSDEIEGYVEREYHVDRKLFYLNLQKNILNEHQFESNTFADFNGDGRTDFLSIENDQLNVYELNQNYQPVKIFSTPKESYKKVLYTGDFNGDGKTDILAPLAEDSSDWRMYISTGTGFRKELYSNLFLYKPSHTGAGRKYRNTLKTYFTPDLNKDGKSDFLIFESQRWFKDCPICWNDPDSSYGFNYLRNDGTDATGKPIFTNAYKLEPKELFSDIEDINFSMYGEHYTPSFGNFKLAKLNTDFVIIHKTKLITWDLGSKLNIIANIKSITQGGVLTEVTYSKLNPTGIVYKSSSDNPLQFPYFNVKENLNYQVVSRIKAGDMKQDFRYKDFIVNQEKGFVGFRQRVQSNWYADGFEKTKIWQGSEIDPLRESSIIKEWSIRTNEETKIIPTDISINNSSLLSFKSIEYKIDKLLNGQIITTITNDNKSKIVTALVPKKVITKDFLKNVISDVSTSYNSYYLPIQSSTNINNGFSIRTTDFNYSNNLAGEGKNYFIGRLDNSISSETNNYGAIKDKEVYTYTNNLLVKKDVYDNILQNYRSESYKYDGFGNIIEIVNSNSTDNLTNTSSFIYDSKGRFVIKKTDNLNLSTVLTYNDWGQVLTEVDPNNNKITNTFDAWGKLISSSHNLTGSITYKYVRDSYYNSIVTETNSLGNYTINYTNSIGRQYRSVTKGFNNNSIVSKEIKYDAIGRKIQELEPFYDNSTPQWNYISYDDNTYPAKVTTTCFTGKKVTTSMVGRITTVKEANGYQRTNTQETDPLGNVIKSTDKGGTIVFNYNASGNQISSKYGNNTVTTKYDNWDRKIELNDPSNGIYKYYYNGFDDITKVESPKGKKEYNYNTKRQLISQIETANDSSTSKNIAYTYNTNGTLKNKTGSSKNAKGSLDTYTTVLTYDANGRLNSNIETSNGKEYIQDNIIYDGNSRILSYKKTLVSGTLTTQAHLENIYHPWNGEIYQLKDKTSGTILWQLDETLASGQVVKAKLGNTVITNEYEIKNNSLKNINHTSGTNNILNISYVFDVHKNELVSRQTTGDISIAENFYYDSNNRLVRWTDPVSKTMHINQYDVQGRITENNQLGKISYPSSGKIYQPSKVELNKNGNSYYQKDLIQTISYNENNDPVFIDGTIGDAAFSYGLSGVRQIVTYGGNFSQSTQGIFTKFYDETGSFEIIKDDSTGKEKHILYIGGSPYESNIILLKDYDKTTPSYYFLHKDYLGSILSISDTNGNKIEQRHFDAWGNLTHLKIGTNNVTTDQNVIKQTQLLLDRGYTSHEHFDELGIIHMNGRLYDPILRRFLNADENIQDPFNSQNYNKYGYVLNNPLMYNDPTGEYIWWLPIAIAAFSHTLQSYVANQPMSIDGFMQTLIWSYIYSGVSYGIGEAFSMVENVTTIITISKHAAHGVSGALLSSVQGESFGSGFISGIFGSVGGEYSLKYLGRGLGASSASGFILGGVGAELAGGNFWVGAVNGIAVSVFNHFEHAPDNYSIELEGDGPGGPGKGKKLTANNSVNNSKQFKQLSKGEIKKLKDSGKWDHSDKGKGGGKRDLYKDSKGNVYEKPKGGNGSAEPIGINLNDLMKSYNLSNSLINIFDKAASRLSSGLAPIFMTTPLFIIDIQTNTGTFKPSNNQL